MAYRQPLLAPSVDNKEDFNRVCDVIIDNYGRVSLEFKNHQKTSILRFEELINIVTKMKLESENKYG